MTNVVESPITSLDKDPIISRLKHYVQFLWPTEKTLTLAFNPYGNRKVELSIDEGCLIWENYVTIPKTLQPNMLESLHEAQECLE